MDRLIWDKRSRMNSRAAPLVASALHSSGLPLATSPDEIYIVPGVRHRVGYKVSTNTCLDIAHWLRLRPLGHELLALLHN
jgi:hypothetical protein